MSAENTNGTEPTQDIVPTPAPPVATAPPADPTAAGATPAPASRSVTGRHLGRRTAAMAVALALVPLGLVVVGSNTSSADSSTAAAQSGTDSTTTSGFVGRGRWGRGSGSSDGSAQGYGYGYGYGGSAEGGTTTDPNGTSDGTSGGSANGYGGQGSSQSTAQISGTTVSSAPGVVLIETKVSGGTGAGTGMVIGAGGVVLTNYHVVESSTTISVTIADTGKSYTATVVGHDETHDVAVLQLKDASGLTTVTIDDDGVSVGDAVKAIGQGGGLGKLFQVTGTVTATGQSITATDESGSSANKLTNLIEVNAAIVSGYSGGPLYDSEGEVIGIDTAASASGQADGYAIPISQALKIATTIRNGTTTDYVHIGAKAAIGVQVINSGTASTGQWGYGPNGTGSESTTGSSTSTGAGATINAVIDGGAASKAGLAAGDTITAVGSTKVNSADALADLMDSYSPGDTVTLHWTTSAGSSKSASVTLGTSTVN